MRELEITEIVNKYALPELRRSTDGGSYYFPSFEHRVDSVSSVTLYSLIRYYKSSRCLEIGTWFGGLTRMIMSALLKGKRSFQFVASELVTDLQISTLRNCLQECGASPTMVGDITNCSLKSLPSNIELLIIDTSHDESTTAFIVKNIFRRLRQGALVVIHDWAVKEIDGEWLPKEGSWPETQYLIDLHNKGKLPLEKLYWNFVEQGGPEMGFFIYKPL